MENRFSFNRQDNLGKSVFAGLFWSYAERITAQGVSFIVSIILARLIAPNEFGLLSMVNVLITLLNALSTSGFGNSLIQKKDADQVDFSTIFWSSTTISLILAFLLFIFSPVIASFYNNTRLVWVLRVMSIRLPISAINSVQHAYVQRRMEFRKFFFSTIIGTIISAVIGIDLAYRGFGVWALVVQYLTNSFIDTIVVFLTTRWHPTFTFSFARFRPLFSFGYKIMFAVIISDITAQIRALVIGRRYSSEDLAFYDRGNSFPVIIVNNISTVLAKVAFPAFSSINDDDYRLKQMMRQSIRLCIYFTAPLMIGLFSVSNTLIVVLLTKEWEGAIVFVQIFCIYYIFHPLESISSQMIKAKGLSNIYVLLVSIQCALEIGFLTLAVMFTDKVLYIGIAALFSKIGTFTATLLFNRKYVGYFVKEQLRDILPNVFLAIIMGCGVFLIGLIDMNSLIIKLILQIVAGTAIYTIMSILTHNSSFIYAVGLCRQIIFKGNKRKG